MNNCAISRWDDPNDINRRLKELTSQEIWEVDDEYYENEILPYFNEKCTKSKAIYEEAQNYIPGGVQHNLAFNKPFPMCIERAEGAYMYDKDGNKYIDFLQAGGPTILGSNYPVVQEKVIELIKTCGPTTGLLHEAELLIAKEINKHMPNVEMFRMLGSGTEAVMASLRIARIATGKKRIIKIGGAYHGWSDQMVYGLKIPGSRGLLESHGIPKGAYKLTDEVRPNDLNMLESMLRKNKLKGGTAAVILEPVGPESGTRPIAHDYNKAVRALCDKYGALMIFDEVVTGFRVALSGAQGYFDVVPDLTIFGKIVAGGYPAAGGVGGKKEYAQLMAAGLATGKHRAYVGGTLAANPLSSLAGYVAIQEIERTNACEIAGKMGFLKRAVFYW
ncbi:MAG: aminotransferase class III-fold pyridoxal phosphate-dependent enzyme [Parasporobacterium sp.]|nr:aminotransferase class III-fold pyridoxal phosphate-dependent enzyme [Parasporobacterium sp.]